MKAILRNWMPGARAAQGDRLLDPREFQPSDEGSGRFGRWFIDDAGLPAYRYDIDQYRHPFARYNNTQHLNRRDHWHQIGNDRVNATASNDGTLQLYIADRGGVFINHFEYRDYETESDPGEAPVSVREKILNLVSSVLLSLARGNRKLRAWWYKLRASQINRAQHEFNLPRGAAGEQALRAAQPRVITPIMTPYAYAGGFGYVDDGFEAWATAYRYRPAGADTRRVFGIGYFDTATTHRDIQVARRTYAPCGDDPVLINDVRIDNAGATPVNLRYYEYWDVNIHRLKLQWTRSGPFAAAGDDERRALNDDFHPSVSWDPGAQILRFHQALRAGLDPAAHDQIDDVDRQPFDVFLADLSASPAAAQFTDKAAFFGEGGARQPDAVRARRDGEVGLGNPKGSMPYCLVLRHDLRLEPKTGVALRFAYGAARPRQELAFLDAWRTGDPFDTALQQTRQELVYFAADGETVLQREMAWHANNLLSSTVYNAYHDTHLTPQGSAYLYLHGADGAPRDQALFTLPLAYLRPQLARDTLRLIMSLTHADTGAIPYAFAGHGFHSDALGLHAAPSDLDLFFLLALSEYLAATGDWAFLHAEAPFYPSGARPKPPLGLTVLDHVRVAVQHLVDSVGLGDHGLIKIGDGDWSDAIVIETALKDSVLGVNFEKSKAGGESVPNSQMALYVLPLMAAIVEKHDGALAATMRGLSAGLRSALKDQWNGRWFKRAILRDIADRPVVIGDAWIDLEAQPWALISDLAAGLDAETTLIDSIARLLDDPSPIGAKLSERGMVWPAVSQLLTWGYTRGRQDLAWRSLKRHTFAAHAAACPETWINIWSGPDGVHTPDAADPGGTWSSPVTPMTDFPVMNANQDAMALLGLLRVCGIEPAPTGDGLTIAPQPPPERFVLDTPLLRLEVAPGRIAGEYRAAATGALVLHICVPSGAREVTAAAGGGSVVADRAQDGQVKLPLEFQADQVVPFEVLWRL